MKKLKIIQSEARELVSSLASVIFGFLILCQSINVAAANFNVKKLTLDDLKTLEKRRVPKDFPHYATNLIQSCETSNGSKWRDTIRAGWTNDFFWGSHIWRRGARLFEGKRQNRNLFTIRVSYASETSRANRNNLTYRIKGNDLTEELSKGVSAEYQSGGGYWRRCTLKAGTKVRDYDAIAVDTQKSELDRLTRHARELDLLAVRQEMVAIDISKYGLKIDYLFDFASLIPPLESRITSLKKAEELQIADLPKRESAPSTKKNDRVEVYPYARNLSPFKNWPDQELCQVVSNALASEQIMIELRSRGITCGLSGEVVAGTPSGTNQLKRAEEEQRLADAEKARKQAEEEKQLADAERVRKQAEEEKAKLLADRESPKIQITSIQSKGAMGTVEGWVTDDGVLDVVMVDGQILEIRSDGSFTHEVYIPRTGKTFNIIAFDESGKRAEQNLKLDRSTAVAPRGPQFASLNPAGRPAKINRNTAALIVGIAEYERTPAPAAFADRDAQYFYDYATLKLGVPEENILELINEKADRIEFKLAVRNWLTSITEANTDLYIFFAGHGMGSDDGKSMFLLPYDGTPALLEDSAIRRDQLFKDIASLNPNSVTVFLDTCYSGSTRESEMLIAARPVLIKVNEQEIPDGFTVFTAASGEQTAKPLPEVEQGLFSYFLMRGLEGEADIDQNGEVSAGELHEYTRKNVSRFSSGTQTPEFQGDSERVLVTFK